MEAVRLTNVELHRTAERVAAKAARTMAGAVARPRARSLLGGCPIVMSAADVL